MPEIMEPEVKSTHKAEVVPFRMEKHPNADSLSVVQVWGYSCCVRTADWPADTTIAVYLPPDSSVDVKRPEFAFLAPDAKADGRARIRAKRLRGIVSFGCLIPAPAGARLGDDVAELLGVTHYEPPIKGEGGDPKQRLIGNCEVAAGPNLFTVRYDVDALRRYHHLFQAGEPVVVTEKIDGANSRFAFHDGAMHCGSRESWKKEYPDYSHVTVEHLTANGVPEDKAREVVERLHAKPKRRNMWWEILDRTPTLARFCEDHPGLVVYGEAFGNVGRIKYGVPDGFAAFDLMRDGRWVDAMESRELLLSAGVPCAPLVAEMAYDFDAVCELADGNTLVPGARAGVIREGVVIKPLVERRDPHIGRVQLKAVSAIYLERF